MDDPLRPVAVESLRSDLARVRGALLEGHASLDRYQSRQQAVARLDRAEASLVRPLSTVAFWRLVQSALVEIGDGHLKLEPTEAMYSYHYDSPGRCLPFSVISERGRLYVGTLRHASAKVRAGREILSVAGIPVPALIDSLTRFVSRDGDVESRPRHVLQRDFSLLLALAMDYPPTIGIRFAPEAGAPDSLALTLLTYKELSKPPPSPTLSLTRAPDGRTAIMTIPSFAADGKPSLEKFLKERFRELNRGPVEDLIIDVRRNGGGRDAMGALLYSYVAADTFRFVQRRWLRSSHFEFLKGTPDHWLNLMAWFMPKRRASDGGVVLNAGMDHVQKPAKDRYRGRAYVLCDGSSFSVASEFVSLFRHEKRGLVVGDESGNALAGDSGADVSVPLQHTGLTLNVPIARYDLLHEANAPAARGVLPDVAVHPTVEDRLAGRDVVLERALALAGANRAPRRP